MTNCSSVEKKIRCCVAIGKRKYAYLILHLHTTNKAKNANTCRINSHQTMISGNIQGQQDDRFPHGVRCPCAHMLICRRKLSNLMSCRQLLAMRHLGDEERERERQRREKERERDTTCISVARLRREPAKQWHLECWSTARSCQSLLHLPTWTRAGTFQNQTSFSFPDALEMTYCRSQQSRTCCCSTGG